MVLWTNRRQRRALETSEAEIRPTFREPCGERRVPVERGEGVARFGAQQE